jgi:hypothetical protein
MLDQTVHYGWTQLQKPPRNPGRFTPVFPAARSSAERARRQGQPFGLPLCGRLRRALTPIPYQRLWQRAGKRSSPVRRRMVLRKVKYSYGTVMNRPGSGQLIMSFRPPSQGNSGSRRAPRSLRRTTGMGPLRTVPTSLIELVGGAAGAHGRARASWLYGKRGLIPPWRMPVGVRLYATRRPVLKYASESRPWRRRGRTFRAG